MNCQSCDGMGRIPDPTSVPPFKTCYECSGSGVIDKNPEAIALPAMNVTSALNESRPPLTQAAPEHIGKMCEEIMADIRNDGVQIDDVLKNFIEMVMNEGDASSSTKESVVNLIKTKSDLADKKIKVMELMMRAYLKETNTFPKYLAATQNNKITIQGGVRGLIGEIKKNRDEAK